jgi:GNAT superfamily N-acetyltransferase
MEPDLSRLLVLAGVALTESSEPSWVSEVFAMEDGERRDFNIDGAELNVAASGINLSDDEHPIGLRGLEVPEDARGSGLGSLIYRALVAGADRYGRPLELDAYPYEERAANGGRAPAEKVQALVSYLERFGFRPLRASPNLNYPVAMVYRPRPDETGA